VAPELMIKNGYIPHPLEQRMAARRVAFRHLAVSLTLLALALAAGEFSRVDVQALAVGATLATVLFAVLAALSIGAVRQSAIDAVAVGDARIVAELAPSQLCSLASRKTRQTLASTLALCLRPAPGPMVDTLRAARAQVRSAPYLRPQIEELIELLECEDTSVVGVALVHKLVSEAGSPLYSGTPQDLRRRLGGIRRVLAAADSDVRDGQ
jgi:hypothetical protein